MSNDLDQQAGDDLDLMGPIDYIVVEFPGSRMTGEGFPILLDLVERGLIRILDLAFVTKDPDGTIHAIDISDVDGDGELDLTVFEGASSGLLDEEDLDEAGTALEAGSSAGILVYENVWAAPFARAVRQGGGRQRSHPRPGHAGRRRCGRRRRRLGLIHERTGTRHARSHPRCRTHRRHRRHRHGRVQPGLAPTGGQVGLPGAAAVRPGAAAATAVRRAAASCPGRHGRQAGAAEGAR